MAINPPFTRPIDKKAKDVVIPIVVDGEDIVTGATPATLYAMGKTDKVDLTILNKKEVVIEFKSSGVNPVIEAEVNPTKPTNKPIVNKPVESEAILT